MKTDWVDEDLDIEDAAWALPPPLSPGAKLLSVITPLAIAFLVLWAAYRFTPAGGMIRAVVNSPFSPTRMLGFTL